MRYTFAALLLTSSVILIGCEAEEAPPPAAPTPAQTGTVSPSALPDAPAVPAATDPSAAQSAMEQAGPLLAQASQYVQENKLDLAEQALAKLDPMKGSLPQSMQDQFNTLQTAVRTKKQADQLQQGAGTLQSAIGGLKQN